MATQFFSKIGQELCEIKNSPFFPLGRPRPPSDPSIRRSQLSYDPNRLFNQEKYNEKMLNIQDQDLLQAKRQETRAAQRVQFQALKQATLQDYQKRMRDLQKQLQRSSTKLAPSIFRSGRSMCQGCSRCALYRGSIVGLSGFKKSSSFLGCINCGCPMNAHAIARFRQTHRTGLWKNLKTKDLRDQHIKFQFTILGLRLQEGEGEDIMWRLRELFCSVGLQIQDQQIFERNYFQYRLLRSYLLGSHDEPGLLQAMLQLAQSIERMGAWRTKIEVGKDFRQQLTILLKIGNIVRSRSLAGAEEDHQFLVFLIRHDDSVTSLNELKLGLKEFLHDHAPFATITHLSGSKRQALFESQELFPQYFQLHSRMFLLPKNEQQKDAWRLRDILDFSGYSVLLQGLKNIRRDKVESLLSFLSYHQLTYLFGKDLVSQQLSVFPLLYSVKPGLAELRHQGDIPAFIELKNEDHHLPILNASLPNYLIGQRCVIVLRPLAGEVTEAVVNTLRLNQFIVVQRRRKRFSAQQAHFLSALEHIPEDQIEDYIDMMCAGSSQILLVSKRGALYDAQVLLNPNPYGLAPFSLPKQCPAFQIKKGKEVFRQEWPSKTTTAKSQVFSSCGQLVAVQRCLFGTESRKTFLQSCRTGEIIRVQTGGVEGDFKGTTRQKEEIIRGLHQDTFNYILFSSKSDKSTQQLASIFFPESTQFDSTVVIVKPAYSHLVDLIKETFDQHRYHFIFQKTVQFSKLLAYELLEPLQKIQLESQTFSEIVESFTGKKATLLCISKIGARKQLLSALACFTFLPTRTSITNKAGLSLLQESLIPVWTNEESFLKLFSRHLSSLEEAVQLVTSQSSNLKPNEKMELLEYFIGSIVGVRPNDIALNSSLGRFTLYSTEQSDSLYQSWFFASLAHTAPQHIPLFFQYRSYGAETLVLQSFSGEPFIATIVNQYLDELKLHKKDQEENNQKKKRGSLVLFLWAKKIFNFATKISGLDENQLPSIQVEGWGFLTRKNNQHCGQYTQNQAIDSDRDFLENLQTKYQGNRSIAGNIKKMLDSRVLIQRMQAQQRRLLPSFDKISVEDGLRVVESGAVARIFLQDNFQMIDPDHQKSTLTQHDRLTLHLYRTDPQLVPKYRFLADLIVFFDRWKEEALDYREVFAQIGEHIRALLLRFDDLEFLEFQVYIQGLRLLERGHLSQEQMKLYPALRKNRAKGGVQGEEAPGKNRKFLEQKQYFKPWQQHSDQYIEDQRQKYTHFDLKTLQEPMDNHILNIKDDLLHKNWNTQQNFVNFLREEDSGKKALHKEEKGIFVEYEKRLNENEQKLREHVQTQVDKIDNQTEEHILKDNGIDPDLWYKRVKNTGIPKPKSKVDDAILKQLERLSKFKQVSQ